MRHSKFQISALVTFVAVAAAQGVACSTGSDTPGTPTGAAGGGGSGGASGAGGAGGSGAPSVCDGAGTRLLAPGDAFIDDFEAAALLPGWSWFNDVGMDGGPAANSFKLLLETGGAVGTAHSGHYQGMGARTPLMGGFGVGIIFNEAIDVNAGIYCVDITAFDGVAFWAKAATAGAKVGVNFVVPETNQVSTDPTIGGGDCKTNCYNHPYKTVTLTAEWAQYSVAFADAGGGTATVKNRIQALGWLSPDPDWDFSLDEIELYKGTPPTGPAGRQDGGP